MKRLLFLLPATAWLITIVTLSLISSQNFQTIPIPLFEGVDKLVHILMYGGLSFLTLWGWKHVKEINGKIRWVIFISSCLIGISMEFLQYSLTAHRSFEILDIIANIVGSYLGSFLFLTRSNY